MENQEGLLLPLVQEWVKINEKKPHLMIGSLKKQQSKETNMNQLKKTLKHIS